jgi:alpha-glucosidase
VGPILRDTAEKPTDPITLVINLDQNWNAMGFVYEDDGDGYAFYKNKCRRIGYSATREGDSILVRLAKLDGGEPLPKRKLEIRLLTDSGEIVATGSERGTVKINLPAAAPTPEP